MRRPGLTLTVLAICLLSISANAYVTSIHVPSVLQSQNKGNLSLIQLNVTPGTGNVQVNGPASVDPDTLASAQTAATYAASYLGLNANKYNFIYTINDKNVSVSGPSGGLALTLLAVAGLQHKQLAQNFTATGTISSNGNVGLIGGVFDKSGAAKAGGMRYVLAPYASNSSFTYLLYYISQQVRNIPIIEVANLSQALPYAFGNPTPIPLSLNLTQKYNFNSVGNSNITCSTCNISAFSSLTNFTLDYVKGTEQNLGSNFSAARQQLLNNLNSYGQLARRGFLYSAADYAFLDYLDAFTLANVGNYSAAGSVLLLNNVSSYCSSLTPPPLTDANYEFVIGGELRQRWANITISNTQLLLNGEQTTDDVIQAIRALASAQGWCTAASELYSLATQLGGNYVQASPGLRTNAATAMNQARNYGSSIYSQTATQAYNAGDYATALYAATYQNVFGPTISNGTGNTKLYSQTLRNLANVTSGIWPTQFAAQSELLFRQSVPLSGGAGRGLAVQAYTMSQLAAGLQADNAAIRASFVASNGTTSGTGPQASQQIADMQHDISQIYDVLLLNSILLFLVLVALLVHILHTLPKPKDDKPRRPGQPG